MTSNEALPKAHPQRVSLHNEVHARPPDAMAAPLALSSIVMACNLAEREASRAHVASILQDHHRPPPDSHTTHLRVDVGTFRLCWELHGEFVSWTFSRAFSPSSLGDRDPMTAIESVPRAWLSALPGECLHAMHLWVVSATPEPSAPLIRQVLNEETLVGLTVADGQIEVYADLLIRADGFSRMVLLAADMSQRRLGRIVQQLIEIDTYRMAALMGLPAAREAARTLTHAESELAALAESIRSAGRDEEPQLLDRLTRLAGQVESHYAATHSRFSASAAYYELVDRRIEDIGEKSLVGLQTIGQFMNRRLSPARATCAWAVRRQDALSQRVSRISHLLRTRVEIEQQQSSKDLLAVMSRRQGLQLQLQATVEGLSVAAITYYIAGLINYAAKGANAIGWPLSAESSAALAIPCVALGVWWSLRKLHRRMLGA